MPQNRIEQPQPDNLLEIGNDVIMCVMCAGSHKLTMHAHRTGNKIVGWLFLCRWCSEKIKGKTLKIEVV